MRTYPTHSAGRGVCVIKLGGALLDRPARLRVVTRAIIRLSRRLQPVVVHGGGRELTRWLDRLDIPFRFIDGQRYTSAAAIGVCEMVLSGRMNKMLAGMLSASGVRAVGISLKDGGLMIARQCRRLGYVGMPVRVNPGIVRALVAAGFVPVISTIAADARGTTLNINADWACPLLAEALEADTVMYLTDVPGILDADGRVIPRIRRASFAGLMRSKVISEGMVPKVRAAFDALDRGVRQVRILDGSRGIADRAGTTITR